MLPPHLGGGRGACGGDEEVDAAALELRLRRQDDDLVSGAGRPGVGERVVAVRTKRPRGQSWQIDGEVRPEPDGAVASPPLWKPKRASPAPPGVEPLCLQPFGRAPAELVLEPLLVMPNRVYVLIPSLKELV